MSVWNDEKITAWAQAGGVTPFDASLLSGASLDLRLSDMVAFHRGYNDAPVLRYGDKSDMQKVWLEARSFSAIYLQPTQSVLLSTLEYVRFPNNAVGQLLSKSTAGRCLIEHCHCLTGDTMIDTPRDLSLHPNGISIRDLVDKDFMVYAFDLAKMKFVLAPATAFPARKNTKVVKVVYEWMTGKQWREGSITCTPEHRFLTLDGRWVEAQNLTGQRLTPLWRGKDDRYAWLRTDPIAQNRIREHRFIAEHFYDFDPSYEVHHINENKLDNRPENLTPIAHGVHQSFHSTGERNPFYGKNHTEATKRHLSSLRRGRKLSDEWRKSLSRACSGEKNPRYVDISLGEIVNAYRQTGKISDAAKILGIHEGTLLSKIRLNGFGGAVDFRNKINAMENHKVSRVESVAEPQDTFDVHVPNYENFVANGVVIHNSGYVDANFSGTLTLEIINFSNVIWELHPGDRLVQLIISDMVAPALNGYDKTGRYQGQVLPTAPKGW